MKAFAILLVSIASMTSAYAMHCTDQITEYWITGDQIGNTVVLDGKAYQVISTAVGGGEGDSEYVTLQDVQYPKVTRVISCEFESQI